MAGRYCIAMALLWKPASIVPPSVGKCFAGSRATNQAIVGAMIWPSTVCDYDNSSAQLHGIHAPMRLLTMLKIHV